MDKDKAIVKKTGEVLDVEGYYKVMNFSITLPVELSDAIEKYKIEGSPSFLVSYDDENDDHQKPGDYYTLSDGNKYNGDELIVGVDNIREYKIKKII